ncbi:DUF1800 family protein [Pseudomaricurvus sp. HS19]|uniref:DUF1800 family protein n=1 Tax=Pseudomaricurvus sp. HS19 TaxID=2692626 RepID=UPI00137056DF|nr:DUF1800 family protein [Pseudomaricurvus sp. HS19]MYM62835.1 DUF1592 domain-containing protein [Pseudomaricurvus sp. HS19]
MFTDYLRFPLIKSGAVCVGLLATLLSGCDRGQSGALEPDPVGGPTVMRRLTESQYRATIADIFGADIPVAARFERELRAEGLLAIGTGEAGVSPFSIEQYDAAARSVAAAVVSEEKRNSLLSCQPQDEAVFDGQCAARIIDDYGLLLFRRPLTEAEQEKYLGAAQQASEQLHSFYAGVKHALVGLLMAPDFLLRIERTNKSATDAGRQQLDAWSKASRLSYFLTNSTPDRELLRAAGAGELDTATGLQQQVERLIASPRFEAAVRAFFADMLQYDLFDDLAKDPSIYPAFNSQVAADAREQTLRTIVDHLITQQGDYRELFTTRKTFLTRPLGIVYRLPVVTRNGWEETEYPLGSHRAGIQSNIDFLALHSHPGRSSPTLRGLAIRDIFLCQEVPDPPANVNFAVVQDPSNQAMPTARDRLTAHRTEPSCAGCHKIMDPAGLTLENYDGLGSYRTHENGALIDSSGSLDGPQFDDVDGLAQALHDHPETPRCVVEKLYRFAVGRDTVWDERAYMDYLIARFVDSGYRVPELMRTIALSKNFFAIDPDSGHGVTTEHASAVTEKGVRS